MLPRDSMAFASFLLHSKRTYIYTYLLNIHITINIYLQFVCYAGHIRDWLSSYEEKDCSKVLKMVPDLKYHEAVLDSSDFGMRPG